MEEKAAQVLISFRFGKKENSDYCIEKGWGGIQLSIWDYENFADARAMIEDFRSRSKIPPFITTDTETGLGATLDEATVFPNLMAIATAGDPSLAEDIAEATALECAAIGLSWSFCPVVDVNTYEFNPSTNIRSYGTDPESVAVFAEAHIRAYRANKLISTAKHFPGQGHSMMNSHYSIERIQRTEEEIDKCELLPFRRAIAAGVETVMTNHAVYPALDSEEPATLSRAVISGLLREKMGFKGIVITDCLEMKSIKNNYSIEDSVIRSLQAGCDIVLTENDMERSLFAVVNGVKRGTITEAMLDERITKILELKERYGLFSPLSKPEFSLQSHKMLAKETTRKSIKVKQNIPGILPINSDNDKPVLLVCLEKTACMDIGVHSKEKDLPYFLKKVNLLAIEKSIPLKITESLYEELESLAQSCSTIIFDASFRLSSGQLGILSNDLVELLKRLQNANRNLIVLAVNPFIESQIRFANAVVFTYSRSSDALEMFAEIITGNRNLTVSDWNRHELLQQSS